MTKMMTKTRIKINKTKSILKMSKVIQNPNENHLSNHPQKVKKKEVKRGRKSLSIREYLSPRRN